MRLSGILCYALLLTIACTPSPRYTRISTPATSAKGTTKVQKPYTINGERYIPMESVQVGTKYRGVASFYGDDFHGKPTSTGETYDMYGLTAAHRTLPFNTWLEVRNLSNQRTVIVRINDRGPFVDDRLIDLSYGAAKELHMLETGIQEVEITVLR